MNRRGSVFLIFVFVSAASAGVLIATLRWARTGFARERARAAAGAAALSAMRLRADALERIAERWAAWGRGLPALGAGTVAANAPERDAVIRGAAELARGFSGYRGRVTAGANIIAGLNGVDKTALAVVSDAYADLGLAGEPLTLVTPSGAVTVAGGWYRRRWGSAADRTVGRRRVRACVAGADGIGAPVALCEEGTAELVWTAAPASGENGGYPSDWSAALVEGRLDPHRRALFGARGGTP